MPKTTRSQAQALSKPEGQDARIATQDSPVKRHPQLRPSAPINISTPQRVGFLSSANKRKAEVPVDAGRRLTRTSPRSRASVNNYAFGSAQHHLLPVQPHVTYESQTTLEQDANTVPATDTLDDLISEIMIADDDSDSLGSIILPTPSSCSTLRSFTSSSGGVRIEHGSFSASSQLAELDIDSNDAPLPDNTSECDNLPDINEIIAMAQFSSSQREVLPRSIIPEPAETDTFADDLLTMDDPFDAFPGLSSLEKLPEEIILHILEHVIEPERGRECTNYWPCPDHGHEDAAALIFVSKSIKRSLELMLASWGAHPRFTRLDRLSQRERGTAIWREIFTSLKLKSTLLGV